jgi:hypothetical protein
MSSIDLGEVAQSSEIHSHKGNIEGVGSLSGPEHGAVSAERNDEVAAVLGRNGGYAFILEPNSEPVGECGRLGFAVVYD